MTPDYSVFGKKFTRNSGITQLMDDLGKAKLGDNPDIVMLGGGNPAMIPEAHDIFVDELQKLISSSDVDQMLGLYDGPKGNDAFIKALVESLNKQFDWELSEGNIAITNGSQSSFFYLFNLFAGNMEDGTQKKILLPLVPEYIGYADQGITEDMFVAIKPDIKMLESKQFKYQINFQKLITALENDNIGAICVSRPTNPTGNVVTDQELGRLVTIANEYSVPLIVDNAYGQPFPGVIYVDVEPQWNENIVLCMSLSKLGLPGIRTGIIVGNECYIEAVSRINGILALAPGSVGPSLLTRMIKDQELLHLCHDVIKPFYLEKTQTAIRLFDEIFSECEVYMHKLEGAFFMWLWFPKLSITAEDLYQRLKQQNIYIIPGHNFFMGLNDQWPHQHECIRINYAKEEDTLRCGLEAIKQLVADL